MITNNIKKDKFLVVSGPCVIEGEDIAFKIAEKLVSICSKLSLPFFEHLLLVKNLNIKT